jgi:uncharacterized protein (TIGR00730 family)
MTVEDAGTPGRSQLLQARERLRHILDEYIQTEAEVHALEGGNFRVVIFGSARIRPHDVLYAQVTRIARALAARGIDIVTGGGPGLMEAANRGVLEVAGRAGRSYGLPIDIPSIQEPANKHLDIKSSHRRFSSRLDEFMRLSNAVIVAPGGIGTLLELIYVWQLLQVGVINDRPVILLGEDIWGGLLKWMKEALSGRAYISPEDFRWLRLVDTEEEVIQLITRAHERFLATQRLEGAAADDIDREVTAEVMAAAPPPTELTEEGV